jgi:quinolinate synthase
MGIEMDIIETINVLKKERNAVILAHNYQVGEVQDIADFTGDSLELSIKASLIKADIIVFCGVYFMAETAKILNPEKTVLIPDENAGCPMADMITAEQLRELKKKHPSAQVLCYVNTSADVKAECDLCCTSANAVDMVSGPLSDAKEIIFVPDKYLAQYVALRTGRNFIYWNGYCPTHARILPEHILNLKKAHPEAIAIVHPECTPLVTATADQVLSTGGMCRFVASSNAPEFIVGTETSMIHRLQKENPGKRFYPAGNMAVCPNMKKTSLEKVLWALEDLQHEVILDQDIILKAERSIRRMLEYSMALTEK